MNRLIRLFVDDAWLAAGILLWTGACALLVRAGAAAVLALPPGLAAVLLISLRRGR